MSNHQEQIEQACKVLGLDEPQPLDLNQICTYRYRTNTMHCDNPECPSDDPESFNVMNLKRLAHGAPYEWVMYCDRCQADKREAP